MNKLRVTGIFMVLLGIAVPRAIDWYESANALDIPRDIGVLPWIVMGVAGAVIVAISFRRGRSWKAKVTAAGAIIRFHWPTSEQDIMQRRYLLKSFLAVACVTALLLLIPLLAMQLTSDVRWDLEDFVAAAGLLFGTGAGVVLVARYEKRTWHRAALIGILALVLVVVWAELAVGVFT
jgi:hypothetical protein